MAVDVHYTCDGCFAETDGTESLRKEFISVSGRSYGFGSARPVNTPTGVAPDGWVAFDPYTYLCYCPECWDKIEGGDDNS